MTADPTSQPPSNPAGQLEGDVNSNPGDVDQSASVPPISISLEYLADEVSTVLTEPTLSPHQLLAGISAQIAAIAPAARVCFTGDFIQSVQDRFDARGIAISFGTSRGANLAVAKTMRSASGGVDVVINAEMLFIDGAATESEVHDQVILLLHLAAHEAVHAAHHDRGEDSEATFNSMMIDSPSDAYYATEAGTIIEEYRAELAAERAHPQPPAFSGSLADDLESLSESARTARTLSTTDVPQAARVHLRAATNYWKALALLAARQRVAGTGLPEEVLESSKWQQFGAPLWNTWRTTLDRLPDEPETATLDLLREVTLEMMATLAHFIDLTGVVRGWDNDGQEYVYWQ